MPSKNKPGCNCCNNCRLFFDDFGRANSSSIGSDWTEQNGDWSISSNKLTVASPSAGKIATVSPTIPSGYYHAVSAVLQSTANDDVLGIILGHSDSANYVRIELKIHDTAATLKIVHTTQLFFPPPVVVESLTAKVVAPTNTAVTIKACVQARSGGGIRITAYVDGEPMNMLDVGSLGSTPCGGVYSGACTGTPTWDDVQVSQSHSTTFGGDESCACDICATDTSDNEPFDEAVPFWSTIDGSAPSFVGGRARATGTTGYGRCHVRPASMSGKTITVKSDCYFNANVATCGVAIEIIASSSPSISLFYRQVFGNYGVNVPGVGTVTGIGGAGTSGDVLEIRLIDVSSDGGTWDLEFYVNGALLTSYTSVSYTLDDPFNYGIIATPAAGGSQAEFGYCDYVLS